MGTKVGPGAAHPFRSDARMHCSLRRQAQFWMTASTIHDPRLTHVFRTVFTFVQPTRFRLSPGSATKVTLRERWSTVAALLS